MTMRDRIWPWAGFVLGALGWAVSGQWGAFRVNDACLQAWTFETAVLGVIGLIITAVGAWLSYLYDSRAETPTARFGARCSMAAAGLFAIAILFHTAAPLIIPRCFS
jgi:hypothetical protein